MKKILQALRTDKLATRRSDLQFVEILSISANNGCKISFDKIGIGTCFGTGFACVWKCPLYFSSELLTKFEFLHSWKIQLSMSNWLPAQPILVVTYSIFTTLKDHTRKTTALGELDSSVAFTCWTERKKILKFSCVTRSFRTFKYMQFKFYFYRQFILKTIEKCSLYFIDVKSYNCCH